MTTVLDRETLKKSLISLAKDEPDYVRELISEIEIDLKKSKRQHLEEIVNEDFKEYGDVFKALA
jgi:hypothetical protein